MRKTNFADRKYSTGVISRTGTIFSYVCVGCAEYLYERKMSLNHTFSSKKYATIVWVFIVNKKSQKENKK